MWHGVDSFGSGQAVVVGSCEHGKEPPGSIITWTYLDERLFASQGVLFTMESVIK
jgi:hypothetical protein